VVETDHLSAIMTGKKALPLPYRLIASFGIKYNTTPCLIRSNSTDIKVNDTAKKWQIKK